MRHRAPTAPPTLRQRGFTLVEVLVALIIFGIGLLGVAGLQLSSLRSGAMAGNASVAASLAREYGEMMQTLPSSVQSTSSGTSAFFIDTADALSSPTPSACNGTSANCTGTALVTAMTQDWTLRVRAALPGGRAVVCRDASPVDTDQRYSWTCDNAGDLVVIKMGWRAKSDTGETLYAEDRPKVVMTVFGNLTDFAAP